MEGYTTRVYRTPGPIANGGQYFAEKFNKIGVEQAPCDTDLFKRCAKGDTFDPDGEICRKDFLIPKTEPTGLPAMVRMLVVPRDGAKYGFVGMREDVLLFIEYPVQKIPHASDVLSVDLCFPEELRFLEEEGLESLFY